MSDELTPGEKAVISKGSDGLKKAGLEAALTKTRPKYTEIIKEAIKNLGESARHSEIINYALKKHPDYNEATLSAHVNFMTVNVNSRCNYTSNKKPRGFNPEYDVLYRKERGVYTLYDSNKHGLYTIEMGQDGKTYAVKDGKIIGENTESPLLKFVRDEMRMNSNYQPIVIKMLLESKGDSSKSTFKQAAITILKQYRNPLHYKKIIKIMLEQNYIETEGETPERTLLTEINREISKNGENSIFKKIDEGVYGLRDYTTESSETVESSFAVSYDDIKKKFDELNFDSERFTEGERNSGSFGSSMDSVKGALEEFVTYDNGATKGGMALKQEQFNHSEIREILKICGQKIAKWHIDNFVKDEFALWRVKPGREEGGWKYQEEFLSDNSVGVGWNYLGDLSKFQTERELYDYITKVDPKFRSKSSLGAISQKMSKKDLVVVTRASQEIVDFGIITGEYEFQEKDDDSYSHRRRVVWLNQGPVQKSDFPDGHLGTSYQSAHEVKDDKEKMISFLLGEHEPTKYFLLRHAVDGPWKDDLGKKYHIGRKKNGSMGNLVQEIRDAGVGTKTVWWSASGVNAYFWGYGTVSKIETIAEDKDWNLLYDDFKMFEGDVDIQGRKLKKATETVNQHIHDLEDNSKETGFAWRQSINRIPKKLYEEITGDRSTMSSNQESISEEKLDPYIQALRWKPNLILYGPPGTGKTYHATEVAKAITRNQIERLNEVGDKEEYYKTVTFHQTFSYEEFMEGIKAKPTKDKTGVFYDVEDGIFKKFCDTAKKDSENKYIVIIDEINRGNIAKIFGELITIIEKDKRERKKITLAYSKKEFSVPKNVLIIGTMNTADQSLTHLDAALKRRFTMMEVYPEPDVLENYKIDGKINLTDLLVAINRKLVDNNFRDGQIGHAYFMSGKDSISKMSELQMVFAYDLIPLLRDYFYDDESKMKGIFGESNWKEWFDEKTGDINEDWQGSDGVKKFRENIQKSFGV